ncbi:phosphoenolpyruvate--protein phosphotransferase [Plasticicumulans sp.]|uniref:phosphoenolpyruvate--protein phosphotransferase n=1 Tax=Plasticicumulans sp. TaxID=2307179 RepID=UPI002B9AFB53|nr:phosphoenolpyruvate--protein phosphotransferase [Plasticicumulans sp.]MBS0602954.1 phosphoenolpyruvate--protein phosphotransferase [Pseudomonadota bacterium]HMW28127.1 phosphoenolpyruvate--protein phosphotransferase [Plasticicumulans sp.]HMZ09117.1 phosphoenolpyruvate--protein phosphotransferase [Plasticicumulans sp.]HNB88881.1 phosphoenolpyruvate--protein phosphotransferase [Plasticicumulans sp.]HNI21250.1 phosphoenolpyruvate--protein phosphotransferase [Plasticicumulans sp.]
MPLALHGIGVSRGCAIGETYHLLRDQPEVLEYAIPQDMVDDEVRRFEEAITEARRELEDIRSRVAPNVPAEVTSFIDAHLLMLEDPALADAPVRLIRQHSCNAEWALKMQRDLLVQVFDDMDDAYLRARRDDVDHVVRRVQGILLAEEPAPDLLASRLEGRIIVADDLTPADTILMQHQGVAAFVTEYGGPLSHTAILARNLGIPAVVGARHARRLLGDEETIIVDGQNGVVLAELDEPVLEHYRERQRREQRGRRELVKLRRLPAISRDQVTIGLQANIELPEDALAVREIGADGIGLYRTEFLYMNRPDTPDEEEHLASYLHVIRTLGPEQPITIRTADLGADKQVDGGRRGPVATNPALGLRGIRLCLKDHEMFRAQLRAILRASAHGKVRMMIPMLSNAYEITQVLHLLDDCRQELRARGQAFDEQLPVGGMVEVPAAAVCARLYAHRLDFLSIGTNDLIQYTLAIDRIDDEVNYLYDPLHPAVLALIAGTITAGQAAGIPVSMCGEMAGDARYTRLLLGLGLTQFSMHPNNLLEVKRVIREAEVGALARETAAILAETSPEVLSARLAAFVA